MLNVDTSIPGWISEEKLNILAQYSTHVPNNGLILEFGSLYGRSSYSLSKNCHPSVKVICLDSWEIKYRPAGLLGRKYENAPTVEAFKFFTDTCKNIETVQIRFPINDIFITKQKINLAFIDDWAHTNIRLKNLEYCLYNLDENGVIISNTYNINDMSKTIDDFCKKNNLKLLIEENMAIIKI